MPHPTPLSTETLAAFQAELLELLDRDDNPTRILQQLQANPRWEPLADFLANMEPRMVHVAAELVKTWGRRGTPTDTQPDSGGSHTTTDQSPSG